MPEWVEPLASAIAAVVAVGALIVASLARRDSRRAAASSEDAARAAADSAAVAQREEARRLERTDVSWERSGRRGDDPAQVVYINSGSTTAYFVAAALTINGIRITLEADKVEPGGSIRHDATEMGRKSLVAATHGSGGTKALYTTRYDVNARITWQTELGTPGVWSDAP